MAQFINGKWTACNGRGKIRAGGCTCDNPAIYDGETMCLEYTQQYSDQRRADVCMCDRQGQGVTVTDAELSCQSDLRGQIVEMRGIQFRACSEAFSFIDLA